MGTMGKCCCGDCCLTAEDMPYSTVTLKAPYLPCDNGGSTGGGWGVFDGEGVGVGVGEGEGEEPNYPTASFQPLNCCFQASFNLESAGFCSPEEFNCFLWAKRDLNFSYDVQYYRQRVAYSATVEEDPEDYDCPCVLTTTKSVDYEGTARVFLNQSYKAIGVKVTVGKTFIRCDGDEEPVCKFYIAVSYDFRVSEQPSDVQRYSKKTFSCVGHFDNPNCTITNSWIEESGTNSDDCPFDDFTGGGLFTSVVTVTRIKFYDALPGAGEVQISSTDGQPFSCCNAKAGCVITQPSCGLSIGSNCLPPVPEFNEFIDPTANSYNLIPCPYGDVILTYEEESGLWHCNVLDENGFKEPGPSYVEAYVLPGFFNPECYYRGSYICVTDSVGWDRFLQWSPIPVGVNPGEGLNMCETLDVDAIQQPFPPQPYCIGGPSPPEIGFCTNDDCCEQSIGGGQVSTFQCPILGPDCGRKIVNYECDHVRTDYTVGNICLPIPNTVLELA